MPFDFRLQLIPLVPVWLALVIALGLAALIVRGSRELLAKGVPPRWVRILAGLRGLGVLLFLLVLLGPIVRYAVQTSAPAHLLVMLDTSRSMAQPSEAGGSRLDELRRLWNDRLSTEMNRRFQIHWAAFDRTAIPLEPSDLAGLAATGSDTRYGESLEAVLANGPVPERVLLMTDGHDAGTADPVAVARRFGVSLDVLAPSSSAALADSKTRITEVQSARRVLLGAESQFLATVTNDDGIARTLTLEMLDGDQVVQSVPVEIAGDRSETRVRLTHRPVAAGPSTYTFRLIGPGADEEPYRLSVPVLDGHYDVLVLEDSWRWEFRYLRRVLEDDPAFAMTAFLSRGGGAYAQFAEPDRRTQLAAFPQGREQLTSFDAFILGDVNPRRWPRGLASALRQQVEERGKPLVVLAGPNLAHWADTPDLLPLLPVELARESATPRPGPVAVRVTPEGAASPFFPWLGSGSSPPPFDQIYPPIRKKPAATVLLEAATLSNNYGPLIVMAEQTVGRGRVLFIGTDTLWKWQTLGDEDETGRTAYQAFWQPTLRALASARQSGAGAALWLTPERSRIETGRPLKVRVELETTQELSGAPDVRATLQRIGENPQLLPVPLAPVGAASWTTDLALPTPGAYRLIATATVGGQTVAEGETVLDAMEPTGESDGGVVAMAHLARLANATGGRVIDGADADTWPQPSGPAERVRSERILDLWNDGLLLMFLVVVLGLDWLLRLLRGYV